ncbi:hypothetical protein JYU34_021739 [Plutella xylostella]|uniref:Uncharacterized protein n=1 Tax=Plutella xylostella TaxID=51655 RepID=A0ABQ7PRB8_PLUXY|nr:hypothetical protein JYU34_021739 [Plutella xylostella]
MLILLSSIIYREGTNSECTLKAIFIKSGSNSNDIRISRYRQVVTKCLEQAEILNQSVRVIEGMAGGSGTEDTTDVATGTNQNYYNIFET